MREISFNSRQKLDYTNMHSYMEGDDFNHLQVVIRPGLIQFICPGGDMKGKNGTHFCVSIR